MTPLIRSLICGALSVPILHAEAPPPAGQERPRPGYLVPPSAVRSARAIQQGERTVTIREIAPISLPAPPSKEPATPQPSPEALARLSAPQAGRAATAILSVGATVYLSADSPPCSLVQLFRGQGLPAIRFWSTADFSLFAGTGTFGHSDGRQRQMVLAWSTCDMDAIRARAAAQGRPQLVPTVPQIPTDARSSFSLIEGDAPDAETLAHIRAIHDHYDQHLPELRAARDARELDRQQSPAQPSRPRDIVLSHWTSRPAKAEGGDK